MPHQQPNSSQPSERRNQSAHHYHSPGQTRQRYRASAITVVALAILGLSLSGCGIGDTLWDLIHTDGDAEAQIFTNARVRTFVIETDTFRIDTDNDEDEIPITVVTDSVTEYTMNSNGTVRFVAPNEDPPSRTFQVEIGDRIIERPGASGSGTITLIDVNRSS